MNKRFDPYGVLRRLLQLAAAALLFGATPVLAQDRLILAFGDSLTAGYGLAPQQGFAPRLEAALRRAGVAATVRNAGVSGDVTAGGRARLGWVLASLRRKPDLVIVELGANDMLRGYPPARARGNLDAILADLKGRHIPVLLAGMKATRNMGPGYVAQFEGMYPALAAKYRVPLYPFFLDGVTGRRDLVLADGLHPNPRGVDRIVAGILPSVRRALR